MADETYEGWTNRETWALNLWLSNDQGLYEYTRESVQRALDGSASSDPAVHQHEAGNAVREMFESLTDLDEGLMTAENILKMVRDVGSEYRVDWDEIGRHWLEDVTENPVES